MGKRTKSREIALKVLYQLDMINGNAEEVFDLFWQNFDPPDELRDFAQHIVKGVCHYRKEIDTIIEYYSEHWRLKRMSLVDRNILRSAVFELLYCADTPPKVILNEAVELGKKFGSGKSGSFVNGILDKVAHRINRLQPTKTT